jgi:alpha-1,2-mannosyltransferase
MTSTSIPAEQNAPPRVALWLPWLLGGLFILVYCLHDFLLTRGMVIDGMDLWGRDFVNVWTGGHLVREGHVSTLFDVRAYQAYQQQLFGPIGKHNYSYPPVTYPIAALFSLLPYWLALIAWQVAGIAFFIWAARPWWPKSVSPAWLAALTPAALLNLWAGHYGFLVGGLFLLGWRQVERKRSVLAGICFGLMLVKPHLAVMIPVALAIRKEWRAIASAAATTIVLICVTAALYGRRPWSEFLFGTSLVQAGLIAPHGSFFGFMSTSPATAVLQTFGAWPLAVVTQTAFAGLALAIVVRAGLGRAPVQPYALLVATATFLLLPYAFNYDMTVPMIGALTVMSANLSTTDWRLGFYGFIAPQLGMIMAAMGAPLMPLMIAGLAIAQLRLCRAMSDAAAADSAQGTPFNSPKASPA